MTTRQQIISYLDEYLQVEQFQDYCPNGLQVEGREEVKKMATAVSASLETIEVAIQEGIDLLVVHHGLFWDRDSYVISGVKRKKIEHLLDHGITLAGYHLPLDAHIEVGNNWAAAKEMGWQGLAPFGDIGVQGRVGELPVDAFQKKLETYYEHPAHVALGGKDMISRAALVSGGAYKEIMAAVREGVDAFITGNFDEPAWHIAKEEGIHFFALGHSATERVGPRTLGQHLEKEFGLACSFLDLPNPF